MAVDNEHLDLLLRNTARALRSTRRSAALALIDLAHRQDIAVWLQSTPSRGRHQAQIDLEAQSIFLYRTGVQAGARRLAPEEEHVLTARERFSVAHEIGHWVLFKHGGHAPPPATDHAAYWADEALCDDFGNQLLAPDWLVDGWLDSVPCGDSVPPAILRRWAVQARVSAEVVARAIVRRRSGVGFLKLSAKPNEPNPLFVVEFAAASDGILLPGTRSHMRDSEVGALVMKKPAGTAHLPHCRLGERPEQNLAFSWESQIRRTPRTPGGPLLTTTWISLVQPRADQLSLPL